VTAHAARIWSAAYISDQDFIRACIELGQQDADAVLTGLPANEIPWRIN
jgi:hypothetical protein